MKEINTFSLLLQCHVIIYAKTNTQYITTNIKHTYTCLEFTTLHMNTICNADTPLSLSMGPPCILVSKIQHKFHHTTHRIFFLKFHDQKLRYMIYKKNDNRVLRSLYIYIYMWYGWNVSLKNYTYYMWGPITKNSCTLLKFFCMLIK